MTRQYVCIVVYIIPHYKLCKREDAKMTVVGNLPQNILSFPVDGLYAFSNNVEGSLPIYHIIILFWYDINGRKCYLKVLPKHFYQCDVYNRFLVAYTDDVLVC